MQPDEITIRASVNDALDRAMVALGGSKSAMAKALRVASPVVYEWFDDTDPRPVPWARAVQIERLTFGQVRAEELAPKFAAEISFLRGTRRRVKTEAA